MSDTRSSQKTAPVPDRLANGFLAVPRDWIVRTKRGELSVEQLGILICIASHAHYHVEPKVVAIKTGGVAVVNRGQALHGDREFAELYGLGDGDAGRARVRRAIARGERLGICIREPAIPAPPHSPSISPDRAPAVVPPGANPPSFITFERDLEIVCYRPDADPEGVPPSTPPAGPVIVSAAAPIQQENQQPSNQKPENTTAQHAGMPCGSDGRLSTAPLASTIRNHLSAVVGRELRVPSRERLCILETLLSVIGVERARHVLEDRAVHAHRRVESLGWAVDVLASLVPNRQYAEMIFDGTAARQWPHALDQIDADRALLERISILEAKKRDELWTAIDVSLAANSARLEEKFKYARKSGPGESDLSGT